MATVRLDFPLERNLNEVAVGQKDRLFPSVSPADINDPARVRLSHAAVAVTLERRGPMRVGVDLFLSISYWKVHQGDVDPLAGKKLESVGRVAQPAARLLTDVTG